MKVKNSAGLTFTFHDSGSLQDIVVNPVRISLTAASPFSKSGANIFLRRRAKPVTFMPLLGPESQSRFKAGEGMFVATGEWEGIEYICTLQLSLKNTSWRWIIDIRNNTGISGEFDLIYLQDVGMKPVDAGLINEYYVSQYTERRILEDKIYGSVICCRQNMREPVGNPWLMMACKNNAIAGSTDGMQFYGKRYRETGIPEGLLEDKLGGECAGESSIVALQESPFTLSAGKKHQSVFVAIYLHDHPEATEPRDLGRLSSLFTEFDEGVMVKGEECGEDGLDVFNTARFFEAEDLKEEEVTEFFGKERRHAEYKDGQLLSFFSEVHNHVVLKEKELLVDRPHAHIMQAQAGFVPDERIMSTTCYAFGIFNSHITQGNTNFNTLLSICTSPFNHTPETGQRIFVEIEGRRWLLGVPSAFEMGLNHCRWIYKHGGYCFQVRTWTSMDVPQVNMDFKVISGGRVKLLVTNSFDPSIGWKISDSGKKGQYVAMPGSGTLISSKFPDARFRLIVHCARNGYRTYYSGDSIFVFDIDETGDFCMSFVGEVCGRVKELPVTDPDACYSSDLREARMKWKNLSLGLSVETRNPDLSAISEILPWYGMNALTHFLTPYGLEQFSGAAWGTRDVSQGPMDLLLCMEKYEEARNVLCTIFSNQNPDGGWPQWWMFDSYSHIRAGDSHGDVYYWVIIALSRYIKVTGDMAILGETLPFYREERTDDEERVTLGAHVDRLIELITGSFIPGTALVPFGGGDWNDSLQPVSKDLASRMISSWTVEMNYQAFMDYSEVYMLSGENEKSEGLRKISEQIKADFNRHLVKDGIVAGYGLLEPDGSISVLLHPTDTKTNIRYSILPMNRGIISEIFSPEQAMHHQDLIEKHLKGPDGARLMDRPLRYKGGIQAIFQRAESSTFFGREIGLMYVHEHIRYAESLARMGKAEEFVKALRQAIPVGYKDIVPSGDLRQSNCYYSSSDVYFKSRYEADERYGQIKIGKVRLKGGWRVYSSGPGIYLAIVLTRLLGIRVEHNVLILDPVMPRSFDGLTASMTLLGHHVTLTYSVKRSNYSPAAIYINGTPINFTKESNKYREGGAVIKRSEFSSLLSPQSNTITITL